MKRSFPLAFSFAVLTTILTGCSGVSVESDEPDGSLPTGVRKIVVVPDFAWAQTDERALDFLHRIIAKVDRRAKARGYGCRFEMGEPEVVTHEGGTVKASGDGKDARWIVERCDFLAHYGTGAPTRDVDLDAEPRAGEKAEPEREAPGNVRSFHFALRGWVLGAGDKELTRISISGDAAFDEAFAADDEAIWLDGARAKIADAILDHMPHDGVDPRASDEEPVEPRPPSGK